MGIFGSIKDGLAKAGSWIVGNSGTLLGVAKAVAQVAGVLPLAANMTDDLAEQMTADLLANFRTANEYLIKLAEEKAQKQISPLASSDVVSQKDILNGAWEMPAPAHNAQAPLPIYQDIATFLQASNIPTLVTSASNESVAGIGNVIDVASRIAGIIFSNFLSANDAKAQTDDRGVHTVGFEIPDLSHTGVTIMGTHAYYPVPLGQVGQNFALHSALVVHTLKTQDFLKAEATKRRVQRTNLTSSPSGSVGGADAADTSLNWSVTLKVQWSTVKLATTGAGLIKDHLDSNYKIIDQQLYGSKEILKISAAASSTPGAIRQAVLNAISRIVGTMLHGVMFAAAASTEVQLPDVQVTFATLVQGPSPSTRSGPSLPVHQQSQQPPTLQHKAAESQMIYNGTGQANHQPQGTYNQMPYKPMQSQFVN